MNDKMFVLPQGEKSLLARLGTAAEGSPIANGRVSLVGKLDLPGNAKSACTKNGLVVSLLFGKKPSQRRLHVYNTAGKLLANIREYTFESIACKDNVVYLGGAYGRAKPVEWFGFIDFSHAINDIGTLPEGVFGRSPIRFCPVPLPVELHKGKSIDDLSVCGEELLVTDNIVYPKYLFMYDITDPASPRYRETIQLPSNGTYEHIYKARKNKNRTVVFSGTTGMRGHYRHLSVFGKTEFTYTTGTPSSFGDEDEPQAEKPEMIVDFALAGDALFILMNSSHLYRVDMEHAGSVSAGRRQPRLAENKLVPVNLKIKNAQGIQNLDNISFIVYNNSEYQLLDSAEFGTEK
jgi:hypothetical protein